MDPAVVELRQYTLHPDSRDALMIDSDDVLLLWLFEIRPASEQPSAPDARRTGMTSEFAHEGTRVVAEAGRIPYRHGFAVVVADAWPEDTQTAAGPLGRPIAHPGDGAGGQHVPGAARACRRAGDRPDRRRPVD